MRSPCFVQRGCALFRIGRPFDHGGEAIDKESHIRYNDLGGMHLLDPSIPCGSGAVVAHLPSKQTVAGSSPVSRSTSGTGPGQICLVGAAP